MDAAELYEGFNRVAITVTRDEAPSALGPDPRLEWLMVELEARLDDKAWADADECLRRDEVEQLIAWTGAACESREETPRIGFHENNLAFEIDTEAGQIHVVLNLEFLPPDVLDGPLRISLPLDREQLSAFSKALQSQLDVIDEPEPTLADENPIPPRPLSRPGRR